MVDKLGKIFPVFAVYKRFSVKKLFGFQKRKLSAAKHFFNHSFRRWSILVFGSIAFLWALFNFSAVGSILDAVMLIFRPFIIGGILALILNIPSNYFERLFLKNKTARNRPSLVRALSLVLSLIMILAVAALIILIIVPQVVNVVKMLIENIPYYQEQLNELVEKLENSGQINLSGIQDSLNLEKTKDALMERVPGLVNTILQSAYGIIGIVAVILIKKIFCLPPWPTLALAALGYGLVLSVAAFHVQNPVVVYAAYLASAYALVITVTGLPHLSQAWRRGRERFAKTALARKIRSSPTGQKHLTDVHFRNKVSLYFGLTVNLAYIVLKLSSGIYYRSTWFIALAVYYILLAVMRLSLLWTHSARGEAAEFRVYRRCGYVLLMMNQALMGIVVFMVHENRGFRYPGLLIYAMAAYSFYAVITASVNVGRTRRHQSPLLSATKAVNLVAALVSILSLTTAILAQFGGEDDMAFQRTMTGAVGA